MTRILSNLNVCFLAGTLGQGGAERQLFYILQALCRAGANPRLLSLQRGEFWENAIKELGLSITCVGDQPSRCKRLFRILRELRKNPPDVLQSQHFHTNTYVSVVASVLRKKGIGAIRSNGRFDVNGSGPWQGYLNLRLPRTIAVNSQNAIRYAMGRGVPASRLYFLPNVVDTDSFTSSARSAAAPLTLVAVGRLIREKRFDRFISIVARLRRHFGLNVRALIVGPDAPNENLRPRLENQARTLGLSPNVVQFRGGASDVRSVYHESAVSVLTSDLEGTPNVLLEAMACGLPVVATQVGGVTEIVKHGQTGFLAQPDDLEGLAGFVAELLKNPQLRTKMGQRARSFVEENHSLERLPSLLARLYERVLPGAHCPLTPILSQDEYEVV